MIFSKLMFRNICLLMFGLLPYSIALSQHSVCKLPDWFFNTSNYNNTNFAIGISDTGLTKKEAFRQAKIRALLNYSLLHNANFSSLTTLGIGNIQNNPTKATSIEYVLYASIIKGQILHLENVNTIDSVFTENKEAIILLETESSLDGTSKSNYIISRRAGFQKENNHLPIFADELDIKITFSDTLTYFSTLYKETNKVKKLGIDYISDNQRFYQYQDFGQTNNQALPTQLTTGLWNAYIFNLIDQICIYNSFENDFHHKLSSTNVGTLNKNANNETFQQFISSLKNVQSTEIHNKLESIGIFSNQLIMYFKPEDEQYDFSQNFVSKLNRKDRKELKKLREENWQYIGNQSIENAWFEAKNMIKSSPNVIHAGIDIQSNNLNSGLIEGIHLAKLELSSQLAAKITALSKHELKDDEQSQLQSAKLLNIAKTGQIRPFYLFYKKVNPIFYQVKVILFYELD